MHDVCKFAAKSVTNESKIIQAHAYAHASTSHTHTRPSATRGSVDMHNLPIHKLINHPQSHAELSKRPEMKAALVAFEPTAEEVRAASAMEGHIGTAEQEHRSEFKTTLTRGETRGWRGGRRHDIDGAWAHRAIQQLHVDTDIAIYHNFNDIGSKLGSQR
jgi:hypothetical protein